jgi:hypothetical protein
MEKTLSLLPYLESGNTGIVLDIHVLRQDNSQEASHAFFFQSAGPPKPFSRLIKGGLKCDGSNRIFQPVFMLIQKDTCFSDTEAFSSQTNTTLDQAWQDTIQFFSQDPGTFTMTGPDHEPAQMKPLFYCRFKHRFFHPPCPDCGGELALCKDNHILKDACLDSFHTGLNRYLFCPECYESHSTHFFYTYAGQENDPAGVLDRHGLIKRFSNIKTAVPNGFPCADCPEHSSCYLTGKNALSRIEFLSFYPFYMLVFNACRMTGTQFLQRLSNGTESATPSQQSLPLSLNTPALSGHESSSYMFKNDPRFWLEILFLKYAFLKKILTSVEKRLNDQVKPIYNLNMDSIWINTKSDAGMMPFFWDYELQLLDLVTTRPMDLFQTSITNNRHTNFIAQLCLYIFFVNQEHDAKTVFQSGADLLQSTSETEWTNNAQAIFESHPIFKPENIFWHPAPVSMAKTWHDLWIQTILFAGSLIKKKESLDFSGFITPCIRQVDDIQKAVKSELFSKNLQTKQGTVMPAAGANEQDAPRPPQTTAETTQDNTQTNQAIAAILKRLKAKWGNEAPPEPDQDEDVMETVVLSSSIVIKQPSDIPPQKITDTAETPIDPSPADQNEFEQMQETMVLSTQVHPDPAPSEFEDIQETIVMNTAPKPHTPKPEKKFDDMEKTVILKSGTGLPPDGTSDNSGDFFSEDDDLDKTVILPPKK